MILAFIVMRIEGIETPGKMLKLLHRNPCFASRNRLYKDEFCPETGRRLRCREFRAEEPSSACTRLVRGRRWNSCLDDAFIDLTNRMRFLMPGMGEIVSVDATTIKSYARRKPVADGHVPGKCPSARQVCRVQ